MVYFSTRFFLATIFLSTRVSFLLASSGKCCEGDKTCSGCWMCPDSDLRKCWDDGVRDVDSCSDHEHLPNKLDCLCKAYSKIAFCWSRGRCCTEYSPTLAAATNLCNLGSYPPDRLDPQLFHKSKNDAEYVRETIWNNDSGMNVPKLDVYIPYVNSSQSTYHSLPNDNHYSQYKAKSSDLQSEKTSSKPEHNVSLEKKQPEEDLADTAYSTQQKHQSHSLNPTTKSPHQQWGSYQSPTYSAGDDSGKIHHHAKCSREKHKCQQHVASQYHKARRDQSSQSHVKRAQSTLLRRSVSYPTNADHWKRSEQIDAKGKTICGKDFQNVHYPSYVPESVAQVFATL